MPKQVLTLAQCWGRLGCSRSTLYSLISADPDFPTPITITAGRKGILESEFDEYIEKLAARRDSKRKAA